MTDKHPFEERQSLQEYFRTLMHTVIGQAFAAAGYELEHKPLHWLGGKFRYRKNLSADQTAYIEFQVLIYNDNAYTGTQPSRFRVHVIRIGRDAVQRTLSQLVVEDFGVNILPDADHWWDFRDTESLGKALAEAGHLAIGYGMPWLAGDLKPDDVADER